MQDLPPSWRIQIRGRCKSCPYQLVWRWMRLGLYSNDSIVIPVVRDDLYKGTWKVPASQRGHGRALGGADLEQNHSLGSQHSWGLF